MEGGVVGTGVVDIADTGKGVEEGMVVEGCCVVGEDWPDGDEQAASPNPPATTAAMTTTSRHIIFPHPSGRDDIVQCFSAVR